MELTTLKDYIQALKTLAQAHYNAKEYQKGDAIEQHIQQIAHYQSIINQ